MDIGLLWIMEMDYGNGLWKWIMEQTNWQQKLVTLWNYNDSGKIILIIFLPLFISQ
jgi:hypothetical protein